jgi:NADH-quinone oxidoreductase subunit N
VAAVPFHFWSPDVYDGSPTPVVAFMASAVKAAGFAALVRVFVLTFGTYVNDWRPIVAVLAALSMIVGSLLAIVQTNVKRTLAYSSINHAGFILMALAASSPEGVTAIVFYLIAYTFMVAGSFAVVTLVARKGDGRTDLDDYKGLSAANPVLAFSFTVFLLAQAGVPFTSGFVAKLYTVIASIAADALWLAIIAMVSSVVAAYLYLRIIVAMYMSGSEEDGTLPVPTKADRIRVPFAAGVAVAVCLLVTIGAGIFPGPVTDFATESTPALVQLDEQPTAQDPGIDIGQVPVGPGSPVPGAPVTGN